MQVYFTIPAIVWFNVCLPQDFVYVRDLTYVRLKKVVELFDQSTKPTGGRSGACPEVTNCFISI
jgi:hypothetical protein